MGIAKVGFFTTSLSGNRFRVGEWVNPYHTNSARSSTRSAIDEIAPQDLMVAVLCFVNEAWARPHGLSTPLCE